MKRFACLLVTAGLFALAGCGGSNNATSPDSSTINENPSVEEDLKDAGLEGMSAEEYNKGRNNSGQ